MTVEEASPVRVAQLLNADLRPYRLPFLDRLAAREDVRLTLYAGRAAPHRGAPTESLPTVPVEVVPVANHFWPGPGSRMMWQGGALGLLRSDADVVVCAEVVHNLTVWAIRLLHRRFGKRLVLIGFFYRPPGSPVPWVRDALRRYLRASASALISYTDRGKGALLEAGVDPGRVFVSQNTLDTERLMRLADAVTDAERAELRQRLGAGGRRVLLYLGRLLPVKRADVAVEAMRHLARQAEPPLLVVVGDGPERPALEERAGDLPVRFVGATYDLELLARYFAVADLLVLPGRVGLTCVHGFANGVPCLTSSDTAVVQSPEYDYVEDGVNGVILAGPDPELLASAVAALLEDDTRMEALRRGARASAEGLGMGRMVDAFAAAVACTEP